jgi:hypothetical protein
MEDSALVGIFFSSFESLLTSDEDPSDSIGHDVPIPMFGSVAISRLVEIATERFKV